MKDQLTREQFTVIMENETETAYENKYWDTFDPGIYVDVTTGEPLFSSNTKYDAQSGWPSFTKPIDIEAVNFSKDARDRKSTRLNSSHVAISYAVFCLKKK